VVSTFVEMMQSVFVLALAGTAVLGGAMRPNLSMGPDTNCAAGDCCTGGTCSSECCSHDGRTPCGGNSCSEGLCAENPPCGSISGNFSGTCVGDKDSQIVETSLLVSFTGNSATIVQDPLGKRYEYSTLGNYTFVPMGQEPQLTPFYSAWNIGAQGPIALYGFVGAGGRLVGKYTNGMPASGVAINCNFDLLSQLL
jgi:hypothetical protein